MREVHAWIVLMFSASKEIKQDNVGVEFSDHALLELQSSSSRDDLKS